MTAAKRYMGWALLLLAAAPLLLPAFHLLRQQCLRHQMKERLEAAALHTIHLTGLPRWAKPGKELWVGNRLFDVKEIHPTPTGYQVTGLYDFEETALAKQAQQQSHGSNAAHLLGQWLQQATAPPVLPPAAPTLVPNTTLTPLVVFTSPLRTHPLGVATPPPDRA